MPPPQYEGLILEHPRMGLIRHLKRKSFKLSKKKGKKTRKNEKK
ncbi:MAG: hypothetical protein BSOLF_0261 [Candidatus Carbobacillus altaicus]|uniref:Uncharacterized protein n=1 Tax=Candidatus Carbonibacillus altaicus TaxID=2163959 RepID=A0A2R6Y167_9BACL|nr:MAG: hypothetical protein BSOLF_0261 [Candidatus Carbobacillus altaicus]